MLRLQRKDIPYSEEVGVGGRPTHHLSGVWNTVIDTLQSAVERGSEESWQLLNQLLTLLMHNLTRKKISSPCLILNFYNLTEGQVQHSGRNKELWRHSIKWAGDKTCCGSLIRSWLKWGPFPPPQLSLPHLCWSLKRFRKHWTSSEFRKPLKRKKPSKTFRVGSALF